MCEPCNVLQSGPRFDFLQPFFPFGTYADRLVASAFQFPYGPMQRLCHPAHFFLLLQVKTLSIQLNCKSQIPDSLFCFSL